MPPTMTKRLPDEVLAYFKQQGAKGGKRAGETMTAAQRKARAQKAARASAAIRTKKAQAQKKKKKNG